MKIAPSASTFIRPALMPRAPHRRRRLLLIASIVTVGYAVAAVTVAAVTALTQMI